MIPNDFERKEYQKENIKYSMKQEIYNALQSNPPPSRIKLNSFIWCTYMQYFTQLITHPSHLLQFLCITTMKPSYSHSVFSTQYSLNSSRTTATKRCYLFFDREKFPTKREIFSPNPNESIIFFIKERERENVTNVILLSLFDCNNQHDVGNFFSSNVALQATRLMLPERLMLGAWGCFEKLTCIKAILHGMKKYVKMYLGFQDKEVAVWKLQTWIFVSSLGYLEKL